MRFLLIGNPQNRRVGLFAEAMAEHGLPAPEVVSWIELLRSPDVLERIDTGPHLVRIDSYGEDFAVEKDMLRRGGLANVDDLEERRGEVIEPAVAYRGFQTVRTKLDTTKRTVTERVPDQQLFVPFALLGAVLLLLELLLSHTRLRRLP